MIHVSLVCIGKWWWADNEAYVPVSNLNVWVALRKWCNVRWDPSKPAKSNSKNKCVLVYYCRHILTFDFYCLTQTQFVLLFMNHFQIEHNSSNGLKNSNNDKLFMISILNVEKKIFKKYVNFFFLNKDPFSCHTKYIYLYCARVSSKLPSKHI